MKKTLKITDIVAGIISLKSLWDVFVGLIVVFSLFQVVDGDTLFLAFIHTITYPIIYYQHLPSILGSLLVLVCILHLVINFPRNKYYALFVSFFVVISLVINLYLFIMYLNFSLFPQYGQVSYITEVIYELALIYVFTRNLFLAKQIIF